jgi:hypothetical protein
MIKGTGDGGINLFLAWLYQSGLARRDPVGARQLQRSSAWRRRDS